MAKPERIDGFIAVRMPGDVRSRLESVSADLRDAGVTGEWQQAGTHHLTLKYVGEIGDDKFDAIAEALREPCAGLSLPEFTVGPLFTFDNQKGQTILAARVEPKDDLQKLVRVIERVAAGCGAPESDFPSFKPHVTLCYMDKDGAEAWKRAKPDLDIPESFGTLNIASVPLSESVGDGQDFRIRRLVKVGWPSRYHRASWLIGGAARAKAPTKTRAKAPAKTRAKAPAKAPARGGPSEDDDPEDLTTCAGCGEELREGDPGTTEARPGAWYCEGCTPERCPKCEELMTSGEERGCEGDTLCESCFDELCADCAKCGETSYTEDMVHALDEYYDPECAPPQCTDCGEYSATIDDMNLIGDELYCPECGADENESQVKEKWADFYARNPDLKSADVLQRAANLDEMDPDIYVRIFRDLEWEDQYGGEAWASIAEAWRDLDEAVRREDWDGMHLLVDHAFDLVHNTGPLFTKADSDTQRWLFKALEDKFFLDPLQWRGKLSPDARRLLDAHIRQHGGVAEWQRRLGGLERAMDRFTSAYRQKDIKMAGRIWSAFDLTAEMFRRRDDFVDAAFWMFDQRDEYGPEKAAKLRLFLSKPTRGRFLDALNDLRPDMCVPGPEMLLYPRNQPIALLARERFLPMALKLLSKDKELAKLLRKLPSGPRWGKFFKDYARRHKKKEKAVGVSAALAAGFLRLALSLADFYDFYALSIVDCGSLPDDLAQMCGGLKRVTTLAVAKALLLIVSNAVVDEAGHVDRHLEIGA
jgi:2'-5' RNA ligase